MLVSVILKWNTFALIMQILCAKIKYLYSQLWMLTIVQPDKFMLYISLSIHQEYCYLGKQKISLYFSASTCEPLWPSPFYAFKVHNMSHNPNKDAADWSVVADFKILLNFKVNFLKIWFSQTSPFVDM